MESSEIPAAGKLPKPQLTRRTFSRRDFLRLGAVALGSAALGVATPVAHAAQPESVRSFEEAADIPREVVKGLSQALAAGWVVYDHGPEGDSSSKIPEVWEKAAERALRLSKFLYQEREKISPIARATFPEITLSTGSDTAKVSKGSFFYYDCQAFRRTQLNSVDPALIIAILATEDAKWMINNNSYIGQNVLDVLMPDRMRNKPPLYFMLESWDDIWQAQDLVAGFRTIYGHYLAPQGEGPFPFDVTEGGLNEKLLSKYNSANPWWLKRVTGIYKEILKFAQNTPGMDYLTANLVQNTTTNSTNPEQPL